MTVEALYRTVKQGEMVDIVFGHNKARFLVNWVGETGTPRENHVGLQSLGSGNYVWDVIMREADTDTSADQPFEHEQPQLKLYKAH
jgi:hypothetical protein